jgi:hypothetical protein
MSRARLVLFSITESFLFALALALAPGTLPRAGAAQAGETPDDSVASVSPIDSLVPLPEWDPRDPESNLTLVPHALISDPIGRLWLLDRSRSRVARLGEDGNGRSFAVGVRTGTTAVPVADLAASGAFLYLLEPADESVAVHDLDGFFRERVDLGPELERAGYPAFLPSRILVGGSGDLWLLEPRGARLIRFDRTGSFIDAPLEAMAGAERPRRIADAVFGPGDVLLILDAGRPGILPISTAGAPQRFEPIPGPLVEPVSLACDGRGLRYVFEGNGRVRVLEPGGTIVWDGRVSGGPDGPHRSCVIDRGVLCAADAADGTIHRWRIVRRGPEDADR